MSKIMFRGFFLFLFLMVATSKSSAWTPQRIVVFPVFFIPKDVQILEQELKKDATCLIRNLKLHRQSTVV